MEVLISTLICLQSELLLNVSSIMIVMRDKVAHFKEYYNIELRHRNVVLLFRLFEKKFL